MRHEDWSFDSLLPDDQNVVVKLLAVASLDAQAVISEFVCARVFSKYVTRLMSHFSCKLLGQRIDIRHPCLENGCQML